MSQPTKKPPPLHLTYRGVSLDFGESVLTILDFGGVAAFEVTIENAEKLKDNLAAWIAWKKSDQPPPTTNT